MASPSEDQRDQEDDSATKEMLHKTKLIQFLGRNTPIILQNDNGPCPLLAICNVLLLRNNLNLRSEVAEVSQEKLLSLVAERLIDSNSNVDNKDEGYIENQQQNISDAIDLLPRLTTGIDVNLKFTRIDDFEFTRECAIFDLLDVPLYHGWIVDPQDSDTADAIGLKSYNTLMGELVALDTQNPENELKKHEEDFVDFVAATTASLGVPSPSLSKTKSFDEKKERKGDLEEEKELLIALKLSETSNDIKVDNTVENNSYENPPLEKQEPENDGKVDDTVMNTSSESSNDLSLEKQEPKNDGKVDDTVKNNSSESSNDLSLGKQEHENNGKVDYAVKNGPSVNSIDPAFEKQEHKNDRKVDYTVKNDFSENLNDPSLEKQEPENDDVITFRTDPLQDVGSSLQDKLHDQIEAPSVKHDMLVKSKYAVDGQGDSDLALPVNTRKDNSRGEQIHDQSVEGNGVSLLSSKGLTQSVDESISTCLTESGDGSEPIYEGEEHIQETSIANYEDGEPMYEGEVALAEQGNKVSSSAYEVKGKDGITPKQGKLIRNYLKNTANQLTIFGLFSLQEGLKERELCVFFRNNHFNTMFKFEGELYLLATDQGYINQSDLVWEKLNEVNGDTVYMTGSFKEFNTENPETRSWDEQNALTNTAEYIASIDNAAQENTSFNSDLQLAIALQQQEFEQQQQEPQPQQTQRNLPQSSTVGGSGLVTGPQHVQPSRPRNSSSSSKQESKSSKDRCNVM